MFSKSQRNRLITEIFAKILIFSKHNIKFNNKVTKWLRIWFGSGLVFATHINKNFKKIYIAEAKIRRLNKSSKLFSGLMQKIEIAAIQAIIFLKAEIW